MIEIQLRFDSNNFKNFPRTVETKTAQNGLHENKKYSDFI